MTPENAGRFLVQSDFIGGNIVSRNALDAAQRKINAVEAFYSGHHDNVLRYLKENDLTPVGGRSRSDVKMDVGLDFNHGTNVVWDADEQIFVMIDW